MAKAPKVRPPRGKKQQRRQWTTEEAGRLLEAYRLTGPRHTAVAKQMGRHIRSVTGAYKRGLRPNKVTDFAGIPAIQDTLAQEQVLARATLAELEHVPQVDKTDAMARMLDQVVLARVQTGHVLNELKQAVTSMSPAVRALAEGAATMCLRIKDLIQETEIVLRSPEDGQMSMPQAMWLLKDVTFMMGTITQTVQQLTDMERRELGEPTDILGVKVTMSSDDATRFIMDAQEVFRDIDLSQIEPEVE